MLTATQITALAFPSFRSGRQRLRELFQWSVLDRFQPFVTLGAAPMHYVLAPAGAAVLAAEHGLDVKDLGYRHDRAFAISHSLRLAHTVGVNDWFTALISRARTTDGETVGAWWSETRCARHFGDLVRPDAYGRWHADGQEVEFFLEFDFGTEPLARVAAKLTGYAQLAASTGITTPVLVWLATARREATARRVLTRAWQELDEPGLAPVATATAELLNPQTPHTSPAESVWLPLPAGAEGESVRRDLHQLLGGWPHVPPPTTTSPSDSSTEDSASSPTTATGLLPPPDPMPPAPSGVLRRRSPTGAAHPGGDSAWPKSVSPRSP